MHEIRRYQTPNGREVLTEWLSALKDREGQRAILRRLFRLENDNFGDHKFCSDGIWELRIDVGPGYRVYYALAGTELILLLTGGDKRTQSSDIFRAVQYWREWQERRQLRDRHNDDATAEMFVKDPALAIELLNDILKDGDQSELLIMLRIMAKAFGGVQKIAEEAGLNPTQLYRTLSSQGNPEFRSLAAILKAMGLRLAVERVEAA
jgi:putative addiction module killer protein/probable addiction module antidote protein